MITHSVKITLNSGSWDVEMFGSCFNDLCVEKSKSGVSLKIPFSAFALLKEAFANGEATSRPLGKLEEVLTGPSDEVPVEAGEVNPDLPKKSRRGKR